MARATKPSRNAKLFTIGYEGKDIDLFVDDLVENGIRVLCDVRKNAISRRRGFSKNRLRTAVEAVGIKYLHLPQLGIPTERRREAKGPEARRKMFAEYKRHTIPREREALEQIAALLEAEGSVALTCVEADPHDCHRSIVADSVCGLSGNVDQIGQL